MPHTLLSRPRALLSVGVVCTGLLLGTSQGATADSPRESEITDTGVGITPAIVQVDLDGRSYDVDLTVFNDTTRPRTITLAFVELGHGLDGAPVFGDPVGTLTAGGLDTFTLAPGANQVVTVAANFPEDVAAHAAVIAQIEPDAQDRSIGVRTQVASLFLLRGPRPWDQTLEPREVGVFEDADGATFIYADVENVGDAYVVPEGTVRVRGDSVDALVQLPGRSIIPGFARRLTAPVDLGPGAGPVELELDLGEGFANPVVTDVDETPPTDSSAPTTDGSAPGATLTLPDGEAEQLRQQRRTLLPIAAFLILLALVMLFLLLWWQRRDDEDEEEPAVPVGVANDDGD